MTDGKHPEIEAAIAALGLTVDAVFVPYSKSRNAGGEWLGLNWRVTLKRNGKLGRLRRDGLKQATDVAPGAASGPQHERMPI